MAQPAFRRWVFRLMFLGANITFLPMHVTGLIGMPRRVYTYPVGMGWDAQSRLYHRSPAVSLYGISRIY
ncbi:MAG: cbb3-type cytochrome c oxidase subunit I [Microvirga sp.]|jgi:heme/copper-type cytochrome/quinol oxidase subunit 1